MKAIDEILIYDSIKKEDQKKPIGGNFREWVLYMQQLWRRVNDSIAWLIFNDQRHIMKRLCLYRTRGPLAEANLECVLATLELLNSDKSSMAIWNDATSCVDIGDVTYFDKRVDNVSLIELKEGTVNAEILKMRKVSSDSEFKKCYKKFVQRYGDIGIKHFNRIEKQETRNKQITDLIKLERGIDPVTSFYLEIQESKCLDEYYDDEVNEVLSRLDTNVNEAYSVIDHCLWIYTNKAPSLSSQDVNRRFKNLLLEREPKLQEQLKGNFKNWDVGRIETLNTGFFLPASRPIFLRKLKPEHIGKISYGNLMKRVLLYLDWDQFGKLISEKGGKFYWSTHKQAQRERSKPWNARSSVIVNGRLPMIRIDNAIGTITGATLIRILYDGMRPKIIADQLVEFLHILKKKIN